VTSVAKRRTIRKLSEAERDTARWMLADGYPASAIAEHLGVDVRSLNGLMSTPVARKLTDLDRALIGYRNALVQYDVERAYQRRILAEIPRDVFDPDNSDHIETKRRASDCGELARRWLDLALKYEADIRACGGGDGADVRNLHFSIDANERGDLPSTAREALDDDDGDDD